MSATVVRQSFTQACVLREMEWLAIKNFLRDEAGKNKGDAENVLELDPEDIRISKTLGLYLKGALVGFAMIPRTPSKGPLKLDRLYVSPKYRRQGLARFMLDDLKIRTVRALVRNHAAMQMYYAAGFRPASKQDSPQFVLTLIR